MSFHQAQPRAEGNSDARPVHRLSDVRIQTAKRFSYETWRLLHPLVIESEEFIVGSGERPSPDGPEGSSTQVAGKTGRDYRR